MKLPSWLTAPALIVGAIVSGQLVAAIWGKGAGGFPWVPWSVQLGLSGVFGCITALAAVGIILVYRSGRIINFSQTGFGVNATMLYLLLRSAWGWSFWLALPLAIAVAAFLGVLIEVFIVRRFANAPRLVLTVATIALAQAFAGITLLMPRLWGYEKIPNDPTGGLAGLPSTAPHTPFDRLTITWYPLRFTGAHVATVIVTIIVMLGLAAFFRYSSLGIAVRGSSENASRAQLLGINTNNISTVVWVVAAVLSAVAALLYAMVIGQSVLGAMGKSVQSSGGSSGLGEAIGVTVLLRALAAAVIARMERIPMAVAAALAISIFEQSVFWSLRQSALVDAVLLAVIIVALLAQRARFARVDETATSTWASTEEIRGIPSELAPLPQVKRGVRRALWILAGAIVAYPWVMSPSQTNLGALYAIYGIIGISLVVLTGWGGQISLGQFGFVCVGAVVGGATTSRLGLPFPVALLFGTIASAGIAILIGLPALRIKGLFLAVTTLAFAVACSTVLLNPTYFGWLLPHALHRPKLLWFDSNTDERTYYYLCAFFLGCVIYVV
ncbi:MAG: branched-chain amino acid transport system permease protein livM, partial [Actinomycetota bacterium]|nr:branched-chain amino acid transport system permease protein livM [Actinomycetota bacterium]